MVGGADTSDNWNYLSLVIGDRDDVRGMRSRLGNLRIHMRNIPKPQKIQIIRKLSVDGKVKVLCIQVNRPNIINRFDRRNNRTRISTRRRIENQYDYVLKQIIDKEYQDFLNVNHLKLDEIKFEIDEDLRKMFTKLGLRFTTPAQVHEIADLVAYCNLKKRQIKGVEHKDISAELCDTVGRRIG